MRFSWILFCFVIISCNPVPRVNIRTITEVDTVYVEKQETARSIYIDTLKSYLGTKELTGNNDGNTVDKFNAICGFKNSPWCAAVLSYCLDANGHDIPEQPCYTPSFFNKDRIVWRSGDKIDLIPGDIFGLYFNSLGRIAHVGTILEDFGDGWVLTIEGNTNSAGSREGNGMFTRLRHKSQMYYVSSWIDND